MRQPVALLNGESSKPSIDIRRALSVCCGNTQIAMEAEASLSQLHWLCCPEGKPHAYHGSKTRSIAVQHTVVCGGDLPRLADYWGANTQMLVPNEVLQNGTFPSSMLTGRTWGSLQLDGWNCLIHLLVSVSGLGILEWNQSKDCERCMH